MNAEAKDAAIYRLIEQRHAQPFAWGTADCWLWVADAVLACFGHDVASDVRGQYTSAERAAVLLRHLGGLRALAMRCGQHVANLAELQTGDVVMLRRSYIQHEADDLGMGALAMVWRGRLVGQASAGLRYLPLSAALAAWRPGT